MPFNEYFHETPVGQTLSRLSSGRLFPHPEEKSSYRRPDGKPLAWEKGPHQDPQHQQRTSDAESERTAVPTPDRQTPPPGESKGEKGDVEKSGKEGEGEEKKKEDPFLVDWYGPNDPANPMNWSLFKKCFATANMCLLTFAVYMGSSVVTPGILLISEEFGVSITVATLSLSLFVIGYGIGPMFLSAPSEIPFIGRNPPYMISLIIFVALQAPTARVQNIAGLLVLRFLAGFFGSPPLATGGATIADMFGPATRAYGIGIWGISAVCGPSLGPLITGFAIDANGWRWAFWVELFLSGGALAFLLFFLPETSSSNILYRRAMRIRKRTGDDRYRTQGEIDTAQMKGSEIVQMTLVRPFVIGIFDPIAASLNLYITLVYALLYLWFESFAIVFTEGYGFNGGETGLAFLGIFIGSIVTYGLFCIYLRVHLQPLIERNHGNIKPEVRLPPSIIGGLALPICLFWFGWSANRTHWIVPIIGSSFFSVGAFLLFQCVLNYLGDAYPNYVASVLAANDLFRSCIGGAFPLFARQMYMKLGIDWGCSMLGFISLLMLAIPLVLIKYGEQIRKRSKYAS